MATRKKKIPVRSVRSSPRNRLQEARQDPKSRSDRALFLMARRAREASQDLMVLSTLDKNRALNAMADALEAQSDAILRANKKDVSLFLKAGGSAAMRDRLILDDRRIRAMAESVRDVAGLPDPVGEVVESRERAGLKIKKVRIPLGVVCLIYESRPNVTVDAASLCFKSGNAALLRGGSEALHSNKMLAGILAGVLKKMGLPAAVGFMPDVSRRSMVSLLQMDSWIDVVIPRGGEGLMKFIREHSRIPVIKHDKGVCSLFVDDSAPLERSVDVIVNAKTQRPGVCNALETLYVHRAIAPVFLPMLGEALRVKHVEVRGDAGVRKIWPHARLAKEQDYASEYLDLILAVKIVDDVRDAVLNVRRYYSRHTDGILTEDRSHAEYFIKTVDSSCVMVNTSTRFNDGGELGLGAEIGISTTKMHAYGPMGLRELTIPKFVVESDYRMRQ